MAERLITGWALLGGVLLLVVVAINVISVLGGIFWRPFPGDFELTEVGVAVAAFMFLPYCELTGSNVTADIFTMRAGPKTIAAFKLLGSLVALGFGGLLFSRMYAGAFDQYNYDYTTTILEFPIWIAFIPILTSLALLCLAAFFTLLGNFKDLRRGKIDA